MRWNQSFPFSSFHLVGFHLDEIIHLVYISQNCRQMFYCSLFGIKCSISHIDIERVNKFDAQAIFIMQRKKAIHFSDLSMWHGVVAPRNFQICFMLWNDKRHKINVQRSTNGDLCYATATPNSLSTRSKIMKKKCCAFVVCQTQIWFLQSAFPCKKICN